VDWLTHGLTFILGVLAKVAADWWTDARRDRNARVAVDQAFARVEAAMPALLNEMTADLAGASLVREFVTLPSHSNRFNHGDTTRFEYYANEHPDLAGKIAMLESVGYISDVRVTNYPIYRMSEEFVERLGRRQA
jgi:hypothetical protein